MTIDDKGNEDAGPAEDLAVDGYYWSSLLTEGGEGTCTSFSLNGDKITCIGGFYYNEDIEKGGEMGESRLLDSESCTFLLNDQTQYMSVGGDNPDEYMSRDEFMNYLDEVKDSGLGLIFYVENGAVTKAVISS